MNLINHKSSFGRFPFKVTFSWRKDYWYLFPQGCNWTKAVAEHTYCSERSTPSYPNVWQHRFFGLMYKYEFMWLFFNIVFELVENPTIQSTQYKSETSCDVIEYLKKKEINFAELGTAIRYLQSLEKGDLTSITAEFEIFSRQDITAEMINKFKMTGLSNEDFLTSDFLNRYGLKNLLQLLNHSE
jgi:hypothetical protein